MSDASGDGQQQKLLESAIDHSWKYFAFHAEQRMKVFNFFFLAINALVAAAAGAAYAKLWLFVSLSGAAVFFVSIVFYVLDRRNKQLVEIGELALLDFQKEVDSRLSHISAKLNIEDYYPIQFIKRSDMLESREDFRHLLLPGFFKIQELSDLNVSRFSAMRTHSSAIVLIYRFYCIVGFLIFLGGLIFGIFSLLDRPAEISL
jgi:hypothetical protein